MSVSPIIHKRANRLGILPILADYAATRSAFSWEAATRELGQLPQGGLNIAHAAVDRHVDAGRGERLALRWVGKDDSRRDFSYRELRELSSRFANVLAGLDVAAGARVFMLTGRVPELYVGVIGALKRKAVVCPLFSAFGPEPIRMRLELGDAEVLVTTAALYARKVAPLRDGLPRLRHVLVVTAGEPAPPGTLDFWQLMKPARAEYEIPATNPEELALLHFTSGTTGQPKGAVHVHGAVVAHHATGRIALDLHPDDVFWCTADPGWVTGMSYGIVSPLTNGVTSIVDEGDFDAERWYGILEREKVSVWYTAPTAIRMMMRTGTAAARSRSFPGLRFIASVGEPLNPQAVHWGVEAFGLPIHDNWWQTETGGIMIANYAAVDIKPGSMGLPLPGIEAAIVRRLDSGAIEVVTEPDGVGEIALRPGWPSMFRGYLGQPERYRKCFADGWYLSGDLGRRDADGYFWFVGRDDDVIKSSGHLIGPFEVETVLMEHPAVAEAGVIGKPDPVQFETVKAFVSLKPGFEPGEPLRRDLLGFVRKRLGAAIAPKEIDFLPTLPRTRSGKIMRRLLKARELGLPEGDTSTLEAGA